MTINVDKFWTGAKRGLDERASRSPPVGQPVRRRSSSRRGGARSAARAAVVWSTASTLTPAADAGSPGSEQFLGGPLALYLAELADHRQRRQLSAQLRGAGTVEVTITATRDTLAPIQTELTQGSFKVGTMFPLPRRACARSTRRSRDGALSRALAL